jgi:hypothetical protein
VTQRDNSQVIVNREGILAPMSVAIYDTLIYRIYIYDNADVLSVAILTCITNDIGQVLLFVLEK